MNFNEEKFLKHPKDISRMKELFKDVGYNYTPSCLIVVASIYYTKSKVHISLTWLSNTNVETNSSFH